MGPAREQICAPLLVAFRAGQCARK